jgi:hypothetical protein
MDLFMTVRYDWDISHSGGALHKPLIISYILAEPNDLPSNANTIPFGIKIQGMAEEQGRDVLSL